MSERFSLEEQTEILREIVRKHTHHIPFQNTHLLLKDKPVNVMTKKAIYYRMIADKQGGCCYEQASLLYFIMKDLGFEIYRVLAYEKEEFNKDALQPHAFNIVKLSKLIQNDTDATEDIMKTQSQYYLIDCGWGYNSFSQPLPINFTDPEQIIHLGNNESYRLTLKSDENYAILESFMNDKWTLYYTFSLPFQDASQELIEQNYFQLTQTDEFYPVKDKYFKIGSPEFETIPTENNTDTSKIIHKRSQFYFELESHEGFYRLFENGEITQKVQYTDYETFKRDIVAKYGFEMPNLKELKNQQNDQ
eukprot:403347507